MKIKIFSCLTVLLICLTMYGQGKNEPKFKKSKSYSKSYPLSNSDRVKLSNQFGEMKLNTWNKNEIKVDIQITGSADDESRAQSIVDKISISDNKSGNTVSFQTNFANNDSRENKKGTTGNTSMAVNYTVYLPADNVLDASNHFGAMIVPDYRGEATLESKFGSLTAGKILNAKKINVAFGAAKIEQVNNGDLTIQYSSATVNKLTGNVDANISFSSPVKINVDNDLKGLDLDNSYSTVYLDLNKNMSASYALKNSFSSFSNKSSFNINEDNAGNDRSFDNKSSYSGKSGGGATKINIKSSFSTVIAGHDLQVESSSASKKKRPAVI